jgi:hypothetical protein
MGKLVFILSYFFIGTACGVKGDPMPPEKPTSIGRGHPTFRKAGARLQPRVEDEEDQSPSKKTGKGKDYGENE